MRHYYIVATLLVLVLIGCKRKEEKLVLAELISTNENQWNATNLIVTNYGPMGLSTHVEREAAALTNTYYEGARWGLLWSNGCNRPIGVVHYLPGRFEQFNIQYPQP